MPNRDAFEQAVKLLPERLRKPLLFLPAETQQAAEELRLRSGRNLSLNAGGSLQETELAVSAADVRETLDRASGYSFHTVQESMKQGYITAQGGYRIGLGGSVITDGGSVSGFRSVSSLCIRIPHSAACVPEELFERSKGRSVLIYSEPGAGKTTFLRELVRLSSEAGYRTALADERGEIAAMREGVPQFDVGRNTDVLEFCPKAEAAELLLRAMNPQLLAMDELTRRESELLYGLAASGVRVIATAHAGSTAELRQRGIEPDAFDVLVRIRLQDGRRHYDAEVGKKC